MQREPLPPPLRRHSGHLTPPHPAAVHGGDAAGRGAGDVRPPRVRGLALLALVQERLYRQVRGRRKRLLVAHAVVDCHLLLLVRHVFVLEHAHRHFLFGVRGEAALAAGDVAVLLQQQPFVPRPPVRLVPQEKALHLSLRRRRKGAVRLDVQPVQVVHLDGVEHPQAVHRARPQCRVDAGNRRRRTAVRRAGRAAQTLSDEVLVLGDGCILADAARRKKREVRGVAAVLRHKEAEALKLTLVQRLEDLAVVGDNLHQRGGDVQLVLQLRLQEGYVRRQADRQVLCATDHLLQEAKSHLVNLKQHVALPRDHVKRQPAELQRSLQRGEQQNVQAVLEQHALSGVVRLRECVFEHVDLQPRRHVRQRADQLVEVSRRLAVQKLLVRHLRCVDLHRLLPPSPILLLLLHRPPRRPVPHEARQDYRRRDERQQVCPRCRLHNSNRQHVLKVALRHSGDVDRPSILGGTHLLRLGLRVRRTLGLALLAAVQVKARLCKLHAGEAVATDAGLGVVRVEWLENQHGVRVIGPRRQSHRHGSLAHVLALHDVEREVHLRRDVPQPVAPLLVLHAASRRRILGAHLKQRVGRVRQLQHAVRAFVHCARLEEQGGVPSGHRVRVCTHRRRRQEALHLLVEDHHHVKAAHGVLLRRVVPVVSVHRRLVLEQVDRPRPTRVRPESTRLTRRRLNRALQQRLVVEPAPQFDTGALHRGGVEAEAAGDVHQEQLLAAPDTLAVVAHLVPWQQLPHVAAHAGVVHHVLHVAGMLQDHARALALRVDARQIKVGEHVQQPHGLPVLQRLHRRVSAGRLQAEDPALHEQGPRILLVRERVRGGLAGVGADADSVQTRLLVGGGGVLDALARLGAETVDDRVAGGAEPLDREEVLRLRRLEDDKLPDTHLALHRPALHAAGSAAVLLRSKPCLTGPGRPPFFSFFS
eukprot:Rhum_TRINITY_DN14756_c21_g1::Rhum_TRINITY_DN14756_c21_g1_i1::g.114924::m.114924